MRQLSAADSHSIAADKQKLSGNSAPHSWAASPSLLEEGLDTVYQRCTQTSQVYENITINQNEKESDSIQVRNIIKETKTGFSKFLHAKLNYRNINPIKEELKMRLNEKFQTF